MSDELIEFVDINGNKRKARYLKVINHNVRDAVNDTMITVKYVEAMIVGRRGEHKEWYPLEEFKKMNPRMEVKEE